MLGFPYFHVKIFATTCQGLVGCVISQIPWDIVPCEYFKGDLQFRLWQRLALARTAWNSIITLTLKTFTTACLGLSTVIFLRDFVPCGLSILTLIRDDQSATKKDEEHHRTLLSQPSIWTADVRLNLGCGYFLLG